MNLEETLNEIATMVEHDVNLDEETRENILEVIAQVAADPSPKNIEVLALLIEKLGDVTRYVGALQTIKGLEAESAQKTAPTA